MQQYVLLCTGLSCKVWLDRKRKMLGGPLLCRPGERSAKSSCVWNREPAFFVLQLQLLSILSKVIWNKKLPSNGVMRASLDIVAAAPLQAKDM